MIRAIPFEIALLFFLVWGVYKILKLYAQRDQAYTERDEAVKHEREMATELKDLAESIIDAETARTGQAPSSPPRRPPPRL